MSELSRHGIDHFYIMYQIAKYLALAGEYDEAMTQLENAIDRGMRLYAPLATAVPVFEPLRDNPRFVAVEAVMVEHINVEREALGLEAIDPVNQFWQ